MHIANAQESVQRILLDHKSAQWHDLHRNTLLHHAVMADNKNLVHDLVENYHLDVNASNDELQTALDIAQAYGYKEIGDFLLSKGVHSTSLESSTFKP